MRLPGQTGSLRVLHCGHSGAHGPLRQLQRKRVNRTDDALAHIIRGRSHIYRVAVLRPVL